MEGTGREAGVQELERRRMEQAFKPNEKYMRHAINLAKTAAGHTSPNPMVGAVIVKEDRIIGLGCHERYGDLHAERKALGNLTEPAEGADMYVTLEPCPMCAGAIMNSRIRHVVFGARDAVKGACGSVIDLFYENFPDKAAVFGGVLAEESAEKLSTFFDSVRK